MKTFAFDKDLVLDQNGTIILSDGADATVYTINQRVRTIQTEWFENRTLGEPWYDYILGQIRPDKASMRASLIALIASTEGVQSVDSLELAIEDSVCRITYEATLTNGTEINEGIIL